MTKLSDAQEQLISDFYNLKKDFAIKLEEIQALYLECKNHSKTIDKLTLENKKTTKNNHFSFFVSKSFSISRKLKNFFRFFVKKSKFQNKKQKSKTFFIFHSFKKSKQQKLKKQTKIKRILRGQAMEGQNKS